jgi:hypothetical protein
MEIAKNHAASYSSVDLESFLFSFSRISFRDKLYK